MEVDYDIIDATNDDRERVAEFLRQHFYAHEPLNQSLKTPINRPITAIYSLQFLPDNLSLLAVSRTNGEILGVCINGTESRGDHRPPRQQEEPRHETYGKIDDFFTFVEKSVDLWELTGASHAVYVQVLSVSSTAKGRGIGRALMECSRERARAAGVPLFYVMCTSHFSGRIAQGMGMERVLTVKYEDYKDENGVPVFSPPTPHTETVIYAQKLGGNS